MDDDEEAAATLHVIVLCGLFNHRVFTFLLIYAYFTTIQCDKTS